MAEGPDQGYAWVVALACFVINFITAGLARTAGVLYVALISFYGVSREEATTPFSIRVCVRNLTGPLIGLLGQKYGIRSIVMIGGIVAALGSILCYFSPNVFWVTVCWGAIHGLGFGLSTVLHMMMIGKYFDKYKASALGLGFSGDCFGTFAFPVIIEHLLAKYGLKPTFLILGGIVFNVVPMALLLKEPPWKKLQKSIPKKPKQQAQKGTNSTSRKTEVQLRIDKSSQTSAVDLESLENVSVSESRKTLRNDLPPKYENISLAASENDGRISNANLLSVGHCNLGFTSSDSDISSLNDPIEMNISNNLKQPSPALEQKWPEKERAALPKRNRSFQCGQTTTLCSGSFNAEACKSSKLVGNPPNARHLRKIRSVSDLHSRKECQSGANKSPWLDRVLSEEEQNRRDSLPPVLERDSSLKEKIESTSANPTVENGEIGNPSICGDVAANVPKKRTSSFVGSVAQEIVNRLRTASFASQVASDGFCASIPQESPSVAEEDETDECQLQGIVEHKGHDIHDVDYCTKTDLVLSVDRSMKDECEKDLPGKPCTPKTNESPNGPTMLKQLLKTNTKPIFILISVSMAAYAFLFVGVLTIIIDYATDLGISNEHSKYLIIGFSVTDLFGRLTCGQVIDRKLMKMKNFAGSTMVLMGTLVAAIPLNVSFNYMMVCMCMYGFVQGGTAIMWPLLVNIYMDAQEESVAMGCLNFYGGLLMLLMAPMIGYYRDNTGSYNFVFYIIGGVVAVIGVLWQFEPMILKYQNKKLRGKYTMKEMVAAAQRG